MPTAAVDGAELPVGDSVVAEPAELAFSVRRSSSHSVLVTTPTFGCELERSDRFVNLVQLCALVPLQQLTSHGLLGQTHNRTKYKSPLRCVEGEVDNYAIDEDDLLGTHLAYSRFGSE